MQHHQVNHQLNAGEYQIGLHHPPMSGQPMTTGLYVHNKHPRKICAWWMMGVCHMVAKNPRYLSLAHLLMELPVEYPLNSLEDPTHRNGFLQVILAPLVVHHLLAVRPQARKVPTVSGVL